MILQSRVVRYLSWLGFLWLVACSSLTYPVASDKQPWIDLSAELPTHVPVLALAVNPGAPQTAYAGTYDRVGLYRSLDNLQNWQPDRAGLPAAPVFSLMPTPGELFAGTASGLYRRAWNALQWQRTDPIPEVAIYAITRDPEGALYVATDGRGIWTAHDSARVWTRLPGLEDESLISVLPLDARTVLAGTGGHGLFITRDGGQTWVNLSQFANAYVPLLAADPHDPRTLYVGPRGGLYRSRDAGLTWETIKGGIEKELVYALLPYSTPDGKTYLLAGTGGRGLLTSRDDGITWTSILGVDNSPPSPQGRAVLTLSAAAHRIFVGTADGVLYGDEYADFSHPQATLQHSPGRPVLHDLQAGVANGLVLVTDDGLYRSEDGHGWKRASPPDLTVPVSAVAFAPGDSQRVYLGTDGKGVLVSADGGVSWNAAGGDLGGKTRVAELVVDPTNPNVVLARILFERIYKSTDGGNSWHAVWTGMPIQEQLQSMAIAPNDPKTLYAGGDTQFFASNDGGETWQARGLEGISTLALSVDPNDARRVWAGATDGLYATMDGGATWQGPFFRGTTIASVARDRQGNFYLGTKYKGVSKADPALEHLTPVGVGLETSSVDALALRAGTGVLYAMTPQGPYCTLVDPNKDNPDRYGTGC